MAKTLAMADTNLDVAMYIYIYTNKYTCDSLDIYMHMCSSRYMTVYYITFCSILFYSIITYYTILDCIMLYRNAFCCVKVCYTSCHMVSRDVLPIECLWMPFCSSIECRLTAC